MKHSLIHCEFEMKTHHFNVRAQQRGIPVGAQEMLDKYGRIEYDGHGHRKVCFDKKGRKQLERDFGKQFCSRLGHWKDIYKIETSAGDRLITIGYRTEKIYRHS